MRKKIASRILSSTLQIELVGTININISKEKRREPNCSTFMDTEECENAK